MTDLETARTGVAVINSLFAAQYFPGEEPLGKTVILFDDETFGGSRTIVGIVGDVRGRAVAEPGWPMIFLPHAQHPDVFRPTLAVRSSLPPAAIAGALRERLRQFDRQLLVLRTTPNDLLLREGEVADGAASGELDPACVPPGGPPAVPR